ncbi:MAG TPA: cbb3-type cytochrome c oxidase subunit II [Pirellulaceae bacterium]|nr:cbb3-type cytochrome c oxidase subunit II [Pirellulaceae bacterium]
MFESKAGIIFIAGLLFFALAFLGNGLVPMLMYRDMPEQTAEQVVNARLRTQVRDLQNRYPEQFQKHIGELNDDTIAASLRLGRQLYVGEGCWHCHSQFIRPVSNESQRWGPVSETWEYQNELQRPVLFGTRRVGPDLSREGGRRSNDWHAVHFYHPKTVSTDSPMPDYPWFFEGAPDKPNKRGLAVMIYVQWLGSWLDSYPYYEELKELQTEE